MARLRVRLKTLMIAVAAVAVGMVVWMNTEWVNQRPVRGLFVTFGRVQFAAYDSRWSPGGGLWIGIYIERDMRPPR